MSVKRILMGLILLSLCACGAKEMKIENKGKEAVKMEYLRRYEYGADYECEDKEIIKKLLELIENLKIGNKSDMMTEDYTDILIFTYEDGTKDTYEFEADNIVIDDTRYEVNGLREIRAILDQIAD